MNNIEGVNADEYERDVLQRAISFFGTGSQKLMFFEELAELQKAVCKAERGWPKHNVTEELADVEIMMHQVRIMFGISRVDVDEVKLGKLHRLEDILASRERLRGGEL